jgi:hypothetical protein
MSQSHQPLEELWSAAFDAAERALECARSALGEEETRRRAHRLRDERKQTTLLLQELVVGLSVKLESPPVQHTTPRPRPLRARERKGEGIWPPEGGPSVQIELAAPRARGRTKVARPCKSRRSPATSEKRQAASLSRTGMSRPPPHVHGKEGVNRQGLRGAPRAAIGQQTLETVPLNHASRFGTVRNGRMNRTHRRSPSDP